MSEPDSLAVEVAYATPQCQIILTVYLKAGASVRDAIVESGILQRFPEIDLHRNKVGIFAKQCQLTECVKNRDRVEIYRTLVMDPKELRRIRARKQEQNNVK